MCGLVWRCRGGVYKECCLCMDLLRTHVLNDVCVAKWSCDSRMQTYGTAALSVVPVAVSGDGCLPWVTQVHTDIFHVKKACLLPDMSCLSCFHTELICSIMFHYRGKDHKLWDLKNHAHE